MNEHIYGVVPPIVTPFRPDGKIDEDLLRAETKYLIEVARVHSLAVCGSTGGSKAATAVCHGLRCKVVPTSNKTQFTQQLPRQDQSNDTFKLTA